MPRGHFVLRTGTFHGFAVRARYALFIRAENLCARRRSLHSARDKRSIVPASYASFAPATVGSYQPDKLKFVNLFPKLVKTKKQRSGAVFCYLLSAICYLLPAICCLQPFEKRYGKGDRERGGKYQRKRIGLLNAREPSGMG